MLQMRAAAAGIGDDGVELFRRELVDVACARVAAPVPIRRCARGASRSNCCSGGVTTSQPLRASTSTVSRLTSLKIKSCAQPVSIATRYFLLADGGVTGAISSAENLRLHCRRHGLQFAQALGQKLQHAAAADAAFANRVAGTAASAGRPAAAGANP